MLSARGVRLDTDERYDDHRYREPTRYRLLSFQCHADGLLGLHLFFLRLEAVIRVYSSIA